MVKVKTFHHCIRDNNAVKSTDKEMNDWLAENIVSWEKIIKIKQSQSETTTNLTVVITRIFYIGNS